MHTEKLAHEEGNVTDVWGIFISEELSRENATLHQSIGRKC